MICDKCGNTMTEIQSADIQPNNNSISVKINTFFKCFNCYNIKIKR